MGKEDSAGLPSLREGIEFGGDIGNEFGYHGGVNLVKPQSQNPRLDLTSRGSAYLLYSSDWPSGQRFLIDPLNQSHREHFDAAVASPCKALVRDYRYSQIRQLPSCHQHSFHAAKPARIDMTTQELQSRLKSLFESHREAAVLISRLSKLGAQSGTSSPHPDDSESRVELSAEIHQSLKEQEEDYELLKQEVEDHTLGGSWGSGARKRDSEKDRDRLTLVTQVERLGEDLKL